MNVIPRREKSVKCEPNLFTVVMRTLDIGVNQVIQTSLEGADIVIEPNVEKIGYADFLRARWCFSQGELATKKLIPEINRCYSVS